MLPKDSIYEFYDLSNDSIKEFPDLSEYSIKKLDLSRNMIQKMEYKKMPKSQYPTPLPRIPIMIFPISPNPLPL